ncbi:MAG: hypothetical protein FWG88_11430 [Oscillospiraceae bacterium]|nr:hypothetical protein [Oscillospiraceae bacterium]
MTPENQKRHDEKLQRINDAVALKEPDRVPMTPAASLYPIIHSGYTVAELVYDTSLEKARAAVIKYLTDFDPDVGADVSMSGTGEGPILEKMKSKTMLYAGMPGANLDENSLQQFIEFPLLLDDEFEEFFTDRTRWAIRKSIPRTSELLEPLARLNFTYNTGASMLAMVFSDPKFKEMIETLWEINEFYAELRPKQAAIRQEILEMGFPNIRGAGGSLVPFDAYSDFLRGTILSMEDMFERPQDIERFINESMEETEARILATKGIDEGKHVFVALHKGMDGFMSHELYRKYYWNHLQRIILAIIESGKIPYIYTEGKYDTRIDCLTEVPVGKVFYHFEDVDMAVAKQKLGGIACISGGFPAALLDWGTPEKVRDEVKRLLDVCAPGGGFIFETSCGMGKCKKENVEAMFETVREYGVY